MATEFVAGDASSQATFTGGNDGAMTFRVGPNGAKVTAVSIDSSGKPTFSYQVTHSVPPKLTSDAVVSMVRVHTANGKGSTNTKISRFLTVVTNTGSDITYADSATLGGSFTINTSGIYSISYTFYGSANIHGGISLNSSELTTDINFLTVTADRLAMAFTSGADHGETVSWTGYIPATGIIRAHRDGTGDGTASRNQFTIVKIA